MLIEVRDYATANRAASKISEISLKEQRVLSGQIIEDTVASTDEADPNIYISYNSSASISVTIPSASKDNPYQYSIVKPGENFDISRASWTTISKSSAVRILPAGPLKEVIYILGRKR